MPAHPLTLSIPLPRAAPALLAVRAQGQAVPAASADAWVELLPGPEVATRDDRGPYRLTDPAALVARFQREYPADSDQAALVDYEHADLTGDRPAGMAPAAGWLTRLRVSASNGIEGLIEWTERAAALLAAREARYISPELLVDPSTAEVIGITGAGLTQRPNLYLRALARRDDLPETDPMNDELAERLRYLLNLPTTATADDIADHLGRLVNQLRGTTVEPMRAAGLLADPDAAPGAALLQAQMIRSHLDDISQTLSLDAADTPEQVLASVADALARADTDRDQQLAIRDRLMSGISYQSHLSPTATLAEVADAAIERVAELQAQIADTAARELVADAMRQRLVPPAQQRWAEGYARTDPDGFRTYLEGCRPILPQAQDRPAPDAPAGDDFPALVQRARIARPALTRAQAVAQVAREHPEAHRAFIAATQPGA
jgi:phage I-like protein